MTHKAPSSVWSFDVDTTENWAYCNNVFTPEECKKIIAIGNKKKTELATVGIAKEEQNSIRKSKIAWLFPSDDLEWAYRKITDVVSGLNGQYFKFDLFGMTEGFQFTKYEPNGSFYGPHIDKMQNGTIRKLSVVIQLSDPKDYKGGDLKLHLGGDDVVPKEQGKLVTFPSYVLHEVTPVTKGTRYTLVCWITGKPFK